MRIALLHPTYWPEVERGSERLIHDLGMTLAERGHAVTLLTTHPGSGTTAVEDGIEVVRARRLPQPPTMGLHEDFLGTVPGMIWQLARGQYDIAHAFHLSAGWAAVKARRIGGPAVVFSFHGIPTRVHLVARRYRLEMLEQVVSKAAASAVLSEAAATLFRRFLLRDPRVLPGGVLWDHFAVEEARAEPATLLCVASIGDPRKRGGLMLEGFRRLRARRPDVRLQVVRARDPHLSPYRFELPEGADWVEAHSTEELARLYARAGASVLTAEDEPFGLVLVESLAAGTPVAAARSGSCPEIVDRPEVGSLFEGDDPDAVATAMEEALDAGARTDSRVACRERAREYDWSRVVERYLEVYDGLLAEAP